MTHRVWQAVVLLIWVTLFVMTLIIWFRPRPAIDPARIRVACAQYAGLDLSGFATICRDAGYQQTE